MRLRSHRRGSRLVAAVVGLVTALLLTACGDNGGVGGQTEAAQESGNGKVTLQYWTWFPPESTVRQLISAYEKANPNVTINLHQYAAKDYAKSVQLALNGGQEIDILGVQVAALTKLVYQKLRPVSEWQRYLPADWRAKLQAKPLEQAQNVAPDHVLYDIPMGSLGSVVMYYNAAMLDKLGITPPKTAAELASAVKKIKAKEPGVTPVVFGGEPYWQLEMLFTIIGQTDPTFSDQIIYHGGKWTDPKLVQGLADYKSMFTSGAFEKSTLSLKQPRPTELFTSGKAAFYFDGTWRMALLSTPYRKDNNIHLSNVGAMPFPIVRPGGKPAVRGFAEGGFGIPKTSKHVAEAAKFAAWMTVGDGVNIWGSQLLLTPAKKGFKVSSGILTTPAAVSGYQTLENLIENPGSDRYGRNDFNNQVGGNDVLDVLNGSKTPQQAANDMQKQWTSGRYPH